MSFPEGRKDWFLIMTFLVRLIGIIGEHFFGDNPGGNESDTK